MSVRHISSQKDLTALLESKRSGLVVIDFWASELVESIPLATVSEAGWGVRHQTYVLKLLAVSMVPALPYYRAHI